MSTARYLGKVSHKISDFIIKQQAKKNNFSFSKIVESLETGEITNGKLNCVSYNGKDVYVDIGIGSEIKTEIAYYQGEDGNIILPCKWTVCGFNGAIPEYIKYKTDDGRYFFVKSCDSENIEKEIHSGDLVYTRTWNSESQIYDYTAVGIILNQISSSTFITYGVTNTHYGTVSIQNPYSVPKYLFVLIDDGPMAINFCGYNMQLLCNELYLDCDVADSYEEALAMLNDANQYTGMEFGKTNNWHESYVRNFLNSGNGHIEKDNSALVNYFSNTSDLNATAVKRIPYKHSFIEKVLAGDKSFLQNVCPQINRNYVSEDTILNTRDTFWLPGSDHLRSGIVEELQEISMCPDYKYGLCEIPKFNDIINRTYRNQSQGWYSYSSGWLRSITLIDKSTHGSFYNKAAISYSSTNEQTIGICPACTIG